MSELNKSENLKRRMITVRLPAELHKALIDEAHEQRMSLNRLCLEKLRTVRDVLEARR